MESSPKTGTAGPGEKSWLTRQASAFHEKVPGVKKLPFSAVAIIVILILVNVAVWVAAGIVLVCIPPY